MDGVLLSGPGHGLRVRPEVPFVEIPIPRKVSLTFEPKIELVSFPCVLYRRHLFKAHGEFYPFFIPDMENVNDPKWVIEALQWFIKHGGERQKLWAGCELDEQTKTVSFITLTADQVAVILGLRKDDRLSKSSVAVRRDARPREHHRRW